jgi:ADP-ribose pyrophosphatase YjhB (NUDIX family)
MDEPWLKWVRRLQAVAQNGLTFTGDPFDRERYEEVRGIAAEILSASTGADVALARGILEGEAGYATPKMDVRGGVFLENRLLFVRERSDNRWTLPGGWADVGESAAEAVVREILEESGLATRVAKLVALYDRNKHEHPPMLAHVYKVFFLCDLVGEPSIFAGSSPCDGEGDAMAGGIFAAGRGPDLNLEITDAGFFPLDGLPELSTARVTRHQIERLFAHHRDRGLPAEFD